MPFERTDLTGQRFGMLVVVALADQPCRGHRRWICQCDCGGTAMPRTNALRNGNTRSCGCLGTRNRVTHGLEGTPTYISWSAMRNRCNNPNGTDYHNYGARGIRVCPEWDSFEQFLADMGHRPDGMSLDRIDVNGNYEPTNCRWATPNTQAHNIRPIEDWDEEYRQRYLDNLFGGRGRLGR